MSDYYRAIITDLGNKLLMKYTSLEKYNKAVMKEFWIWMVFILGELKWLLPSKSSYC